MKCISDGLIQKYIDGEVNLKEEAFIKEHISDCENCAQRLEERKELANSIRKVINQFGSIEVDVPEFKLPIAQKKIISIKHKRYVYSISAACILILIFFVFLNQKQTENIEINYSYNLESEFDANLPVSEQEMVFQIIDSDSKLTTY